MPAPRCLIAALLLIPLLTVESHAGKRRWNDMTQIESTIQTSRPAPETTRKVVELPEDGEHWWTTLIVDPHWQSFPNQVKARSMILTDKACAELMQQTRGRVVTADTSIAKPYFKYITGTPCLVVQNPEGQVIYSEVNPDLGKRPRELIEEINLTMKRKKHCDGNVCPKVDPQPTPIKPPEVPKDVPLAPAVGPSISPAPPAPEKKSSVLPAVLAFVVLGGLAYAARFGIATHRAAS